MQMQDQTSRYRLVNQKFWCHNCCHQFSVMRNSEESIANEVLCQTCNSVCEQMTETNSNLRNFNIFENNQINLNSNANTNTITNSNANTNTNASSNANTNANANANINTNTNINRNANTNLNANTNTNANPNPNQRGSTNQHGNVIYHYNIIFPMQQIFIFNTYSIPEQNPQNNRESNTHSIPEQNLQDNTESNTQQNQTNSQQNQNPFFIILDPFIRPSFLDLFSNIFMRNLHPENEGVPPADKQTIDSLKEVNFNEALLEQYKANTCPVCQDEFKLKEVGKELKCGHLFHKQCIEPWLNLHRTCPYCRKEVL